MTPNKKKPYLNLNAFLVKDENRGLNEQELLKAPSKVKTYSLSEESNLEGKLFIKKTEEKPPSWKAFAEKITKSKIDELANRSSSAVLIIKTTEATVAFTFGYGRFLIDTQYFVQDFGIKTALNTLNHESLRSVDLFTLDEYAVQKKSQSARESSADVFGIDISKDVLRAVTGSPKSGINFKNISGGDSVYSFSAKVEEKGLADLASKLYSHYMNDTYRSEFAWVDNIRRVKEPKEVNKLDEKLLDKVKAKSSSITITIPELIEWDKVAGFSFTRSKQEIKPTIEQKIYLDNIDITSISIENIKRDKLFVFDINEEEHDHSIYKCLYYEHKSGEKTYILFAGTWYEIDNNFMNRTNLALKNIDLSTLAFPEVLTWKEVKDGKDKEKIETEGDYNERTAKLHGYYLLDKKLIKSDRTTSSIELCDLMTNKKHFIHIKHRKGGSAGLSHLFAQGNVSAEILLGDKKFRKAARAVLRKVDKLLVPQVPLDNFKSDGVEIVYLILGDKTSTLKDNLPFFSKVNLIKAHENLTQKGFKVTVAGAEKKQKS